MRKAPNKQVGSSSRQSAVGSLQLEVLFNKQ
jgi:hypothetical protein